MEHPNIFSKEQYIIDVLSSYDSVNEKYEWLVYYAKKYPLIDHFKTDEKKELEHYSIPNCLYNAWFICSNICNKRDSTYHHTIHIEGFSKSQIIAGLINIMIFLYQGEKVEDVRLSLPARWTKEVNLNGLLSYARNDAVAFMLSKVSEVAHQSIAK